MANREENLDMRLAEAADMENVAHMAMRALAHSGRSMGPDNSLSVEDYVARFQADGPGGMNLFGCILAEKEGEIVGYIQFTQGYDIAHPGPTVKLNEIFVLPALRRRKIGLQMMTAFAKLAGQVGWQSMDWAVDRLDIDARVFFDMLVTDSFKLDRLTYSANRKEIDALASRA